MFGRMAIMRSTPIRTEIRIVDTIAARALNRMSRDRYFLPIPVCGSRGPERSYRYAAIPGFLSQNTNDCK